MSTPGQRGMTSEVAIRDGPLPSSSKSTLQQQILSEEEYTGTLSNLIRRDFFPHLARLEAENDYLDAVAHADEPNGQARLETAVRRLVRHEERIGYIAPTPRAQGSQSHSVRQTAPIDDLGWTPKTEVSLGDTPRRKGQWDETPTARGSHDNDAGEQAREDPTSSIPDSMTIGSFQTQYTSEDNASFLELLEKGQRRRREAYKWAYLAEEEANKKRRLAIGHAQEQADAGFKASLENAPLDVKRRLGHGTQPKLITSNGEQGDIQQEACNDALTRKGPVEEASAVPHNWSHRARNALFYGPDADRGTTRQTTSSLPNKPTKADIDDYLVQERVDRTPGINFANTRLRDQEDDALGNETPRSVRSSRIDAAIDGRLSSSSLGGGQAPESEAGGRESEGPQTPRVAGYSFVSPLPTPRPGDRGEERARQLMKWGREMGTPRSRVRRDGAREDEVYDGSFKIPPTPRRDVIARQLADKAGAGRKSRSGASLREALVGRTLGTPSTSRSTRTQDLSPAAQTLLKRTTKSSMLGASLRNGQPARSSFVTPAAERAAAARAQHERLRRERWTPSPRN